MSRDCNYILSYERQAYLEPTPMRLDRETIDAKHEDVQYTVLDGGCTLHVELLKYALSFETMTSLKADRVFESANGDPYREIPLAGR